MREYYQAINNPNAITVDLNQRYKDRKSEIERYKFSPFTEQTYYDFDISGQAKSITENALYKFAKFGSEFVAHKYEEGMFLSGDLNNKDIKRQKAQAINTARDASRLSRETIALMRNRIAREDNGFQQFGENLITETLRTMTDIEQAPYLVVSEAAAAKVAAKSVVKLGIKSYWGKRLLTAPITGTFEASEELLDRIVNNEEWTPADIIQAGLAGAAFSSALTGAKYIGHKTNVLPIPDDILNNKTDILAIEREAGEKMLKRMIDTKGNEAQVQSELVSEVIANLKPVNNMNGKVGVTNKAVVDNLVINGTDIPQVKEHLFEAVNYLIKDKTYGSITSANDWNKLIETDPKKLWEIVRHAQKKGKLTEKERQAINFLETYLNPRNMKEIRMDLVGLNNELVDSITATQRKYEPIFETKERTNRTSVTTGVYNGTPYKKELVVDSVTPDEIEVKREKIPHDYKKFKKGFLETDLKSKGIIPDGAEVKYARGSKDGVIKAEWKHGGNEYFGDFTLKNGQYDGDVYRIGEYVEPRKTNIPIPPTRQPQNLLEDIFGIVNPEAKKAARNINYNDVKTRYLEKLGLTKEVVELTQEEIGKIFSKVAEDVGKIIKRKHNLNSIDDVINFYKKKYNLDFDFEVVDNLPERRLAQVEIVPNKKGGSDYTIKVAKNVDNPNIQVSAIRHEIEHILDNNRNPNFKSKRSKTVSTGKTAEEKIIRSQAGHFENYNDSWFELDYVINDALENLAEGKYLENDGIRILGMDIPAGENPKVLKDMVVEEKAIHGTLGTPEAYEGVSKKVNKYYEDKKVIKKIIRQTKEAGWKAREAKEEIKHRILEPRKRYEAQFENEWSDILTLDFEGDRLGSSQIADKFKEYNSSLIAFLFNNKKIPEQLKPYEKQLLEMKRRVWAQIKELETDEVKASDIVNTIMYNENAAYEILLGDEAQKYLDKKTCIFDSEKFESGESVKIENPDIDVEKELEIPKRSISLSEKFAETDLFNTEFADPVKSLELVIKSGRSSKKILKKLKQLKGCIPEEQISKIIEKYNLVEIEDVKKFLDKNPSFLNEIADPSNYEANILKVKKENAKAWFLLDSTSHKGKVREKILGTYLHKLDRFGYAVQEGLIDKQGIGNLVRKLHRSDKLTIAKMIKDTSTSFSLREALPYNWNGFKHMLNEITQELGQCEAKTFVNDLEEFMIGQIGEKLGKVTKAPKDEVDEMVKGFLGRVANLKLTGPRFLLDIPMESVNMVRASIMRQAGQGYLGTLSDLLKVFAQLRKTGEECDKVFKQKGNTFKNVISNKMYSQLMEDNDYMGDYIAERIEQYGTPAQKALYRVDQAVNKMNGYKYSQQWLIMLSHMMGAGNMAKVLDYDNLDIALKKMPQKLKDKFEILKITEAEYQLMKEFTNTRLFKEEKIFDMVEFRDQLTLDKLKKIYGENIPEKQLEFMADDLAEKANNLYVRMVTEMLPTEADPSIKTDVDTTTDGVTRIFKRLNAWFKTSALTSVARAREDLFDSMAANANGTRNWKDREWQKRLFNYLFQTGLFVYGVDKLTDLEFYSDPEEVFLDDIDELINNPQSAFWTVLDTQLNSYVFLGGSSALRTPISLARNISKGDMDKAFQNVLNLGLGSSNYNLGKMIYDYYNGI